MLIYAPSIELRKMSPVSPEDTPIVHGRSSVVCRQEEEQSSVSRMWGGMKCGG